MAARHGVSMPWFQATAIPLLAITIGLVLDRVLLGGTVMGLMGIPAVVALALAIPAAVVLALWMDLRTRALERFTREHLCPRCAYLLTRPGHVVSASVTCAECGMVVRTRDYFEAFPESRWRLRVE